MIRDLYYFFEEEMYPVHIGIQTSHYLMKETPTHGYENHLRGERHGVLWRRFPCGEDIRLIEPNTTIWAYPSPDFQYIVAVYDGFHTKKFLPPSNAVVYNENGTIHKVICDISEKKNTMFSGVGWTKGLNGELTMYLTSETDNPYGFEEDRYFCPKTGVLGDIFSRNRK